MRILPGKAGDAIDSIPMRIFASRLHYRWALALNIFVLIPLGCWLRFSAPVPEWCRDVLGGIAYETFWIFCFALIWPRVSIARIAIAVCLITCAMEVLQLWQHPIFKAGQATILGRLVLGNTFTWSDFPNYILGSALGWLYIRQLQRFLRADCRKTFFL